MKFSEDAIEGLPAPPIGKERLLFDDEIPGFGLRLTRSGSRVFIFQFRSSGRNERIPIGPFGKAPLWTEEAARARAKALADMTRTGRNPKQEGRDAAAAAKLAAERASFTLEVLIEKWSSIGLKDRRDSYRREATRALRKAFAAHLSKPAEALSTEQVQAILDRIADRHPTTARRVRAYLRAAAGWACKRRMLTGNPGAEVHMESREASRDRVLSDEELGEAWRAAAMLSPASGAYVKLLILTLQRRNELAGMRWEEIAADGSTWTVPAERAKNGRPHLVHLPEQARVILRNLQKSGHGPFVFSSVTRDGTASPTRVSGFSDRMELLRAAIVIERAKAGRLGSRAPKLDWTGHDFRRTGVTVLARLGVLPHIADKLLNHISGTIRGVAAIYQRFEFLAEREAAAKLWAAHVLAVSKIAVGQQSKVPRKRRISPTPSVSEMEVDRT